MKNDLLNSAFTFGIFLIIVGLIGSYLDWKQAPVVFWMGVAFELYAVGILLYRKFK